MPPEEAQPPSPPRSPEPAPKPPEAVKAEEVVKEVVQAPAPEKRKLSIDQKLLMSEVQLLLAEKRTAFALLRTGVTVALVPLSVWTVLLATSRLWNVFEVLWLLVPIMIIAVGLFGLGIYLIVHALDHLRHNERVMLGLRKSDTMLESLMLQHERGFASRFVSLRERRARRTRGH